MAELKKLPIGIDNFEKIRENDYYYADKTGMIKDLIMSGAEVTLFTRPRRFGKSFATKMLCAYYSKGCDSRELFSDLEVSRDATFEKYLNHYDVIYLDIPTENLQKTQKIEMTK